MSMAALREMPLAVAVIHVDGIADIAQIIAPKVAEQIMSAAILRLPAQDPGAEKAWWYLGQLSESLLAVVLESSDRDAIDACLGSVCASLREPVATLGAEFHPSALRRPSRPRERSSGHLGGIPALAAPAARGDPCGGIPEGCRNHRSRHDAVARRAQRARGGFRAPHGRSARGRSEEHTSELQSQSNLVCRLLLE